MTRKDDTHTTDELTDLLAEATGTTSEEIRAGAEEFELTPPEECEWELVADGGRDTSVSGSGRTAMLYRYRCFRCGATAWFPGRPEPCDECMSRSWRMISPYE